MTPRVGVLGVWHETNTYSARPTTLADFEAFELLTGTAIEDHNRNTGTVIGGFYDNPALELVPVLSAGAWPSGPAVQPAIERLLTDLGTGLRAAGPLDGLLLNLHGAMVAEGVSDVEAAVVETARAVVGDLPIAAVLDLHANPSPQLVDNCQVLVSYDTYPHVDMRVRGQEVAGLLADTVAGRTLQTMVRKVPLLVCPLAQATDAGPLHNIQQRAAARAREAGLTRISVVGGFAYSDVDRAGMSVLVVHDDADESAAAEVIDATVDDILAHAEDFAVARDDVPTAVARALAAAHGPVFLADVADNIGGGSPGDGTALLSELLAVGATGAVVTIADREVALHAAELGPGRSIDTLLGGKTDDKHGTPVRIRGTIERISDGSYRTEGYYMTGQTFSMGSTAVLSVAGNTVVVTERAVPPFHSEQLSSVGVDVRQASVVVVKGALAWRAAFVGVPSEIIEVATPGVCPVDISQLTRLTEPMTV